jgi:hypothetical protein
MTVAWTTLPEHQWIRVEVDSEVSSYALDVSAGFVADTGITRLTIETELPGFEAAWVIDEPHQRRVTTMRARESGDELSSYSEMVP